MKMNTTRMRMMTGVITISDTTMQTLPPVDASRDTATHTFIKEDEDGNWIWEDKETGARVKTPHGQQPEMPMFNGPSDRLSGVNRMKNVIVSFVTQNESGPCERKEVFVVMDERPPKEWWDKCIEGVEKSGSAEDPEAVCGAQWQKEKMK